MDATLTAEWNGQVHSLKLMTQSRLPKASNVSEHIELSERSQKVGC